MDAYVQYMYIYMKAENVNFDAEILLENWVDKFIELTTTKTEVRTVRRKPGNVIITPVKSHNVGFFEMQSEEQKAPSFYDGKNPKWYVGNRNLPLLHVDVASLATTSDIYVSDA